MSHDDTFNNHRLDRLTVHSLNTVNGDNGQMVKHHLPHAEKDIKKQLNDQSNSLNDHHDDTDDDDDDDGDVSTQHTLPRTQVKGVNVKTLSQGKVNTVDRSKSDDYEDFEAEEAEVTDDEYATREELTVDNDDAVENDVAGAAGNRQATGSGGDNQQGGNSAASGDSSGKWVTGQVGLMDSSLINFVSIDANR